MNLGETRKQLQKKESQVGEKLTNYGSFADNLEQSAQNASSKDDDEFNSSEHMKTEIQKLLEELGELNRQLYAVAASNPVLVQYHQGRLGDFLSEFNRIKKRISETWETAQLMKGGRRGRDTGWSDDMHEAMRERQSLTGSHMAADRVLAQAAHANTDLEAQRKRLSGVGDRLHNMTRSIPGLNSLMTRIRGKRERDRMVVAGAIGLCITVLILYAWY